MAENFSFSELLSMYGKKGESKSNSIPNLVNNDVITGNTILQKLEKLFYLNSKNSSKIPLGDESSCKTIAICSVIVDNFIHEDIWKDWMSQQHLPNCPYKVNLHIHAKHPERISSEWVKAATLTRSFRPEWNSVEVVRAMCLLLEEALKDPKCGRILFTTESCLPIYSLVETGNALYETNMSWLDTYHRPKNNFEESSCFLTVDPKVIPRQTVWKALPGWILLTRKHAADICDIQRRVGGTDIISAWTRVFAPEEVYFPTLLCILGYLRESGEDEVLRRRVTYAKWMRPSDARPVTYDTIDSALVSSMRATGSLFARKFSRKYVNAQAWRDALAGCSLVSIPTELPAVSHTDHDHSHDHSQSTSSHSQSTSSSAVPIEGEINTNMSSPGLETKRRRSDVDDGDKEVVKKQSL